MTDEVERIARLMHESYCQFVKRLTQYRSDPWDEIPEYARECQRYMARSVLSALFEGDSRRRAVGEPVTEIV